MTASVSPPQAARDMSQQVRRRSHPTSEYWDVFTATWRTRGPVVPVPRAGN